MRSTRSSQGLYEAVQLENLGILIYILSVASVLLPPPPFADTHDGGSFFYAIHLSMYTDRAMFRSHDDMKDHSESFILGFTGRIRWDVLRKGTERTCIYPTAPAVTNTWNHIEFVSSLTMTVRVH